MAFTTERQVQVGFSILVLLLCVVGAMSYYSVGRLRDVTASVAHTQEVIAGVNSLADAVAEAVSAERGYALTGDRAYLEDHARAERDVHAWIAALRELVADDPAQLARVGTLTRLVAERMDFVRSVNELTRSGGGIDAVRAALAAGMGRSLDNRVSGLTDDIEAAERSLLRERIAMAAASASAARIVIVSGGVLALASVMLALYLLARDFAGRRRAETALRATLDALEARVRERTAELAQSNESLQRALHERRTANEQLRGIIHSAMDAVITMDGGRRIVVFNEAAEKMFRCKAESALGARLERFIPERFRAAHDAHVARFGETRVTARMMGGRLDLYGLRADGEEFPIDASISQVTVDGEKFYTVILRDITERKRAEEAVRASAIRFRTLFDTMSEGFAINEIICDEAGRPCDLRFLEVNQAFERHTGLAAAAVLGRTVRELFPGAEQEWFDRYGKVALTGEPAHFEAQFGPLGKWFEVSAYRTEPGRFAVVFYDVSERKAGAAALERSYRQLRERSAAMNEVREAERTRIARELHDELAQWLTAIKMDVTWLASRLPRGEEPLARRTEKMRHLVDSTVAAVRRIASDLRPVMLDDLGLVPSIEHLLHTFSERANVAISFDASADGMEFLEPLTTSVYRMVQEALTNVARHAAATAVDVALGVEEDALAVRVRDNGRGLGSAPEGYKSYGLLGIKERAHTLGGNAEIYSPPEGGTVVDIRIPIEGYRKSGGAT